MPLNTLTIDADAGLLLRHLRQRQAAGLRVQIHPLGFLRIPLTSSNRLDEGLYLHIWSSAFSSAQQTSSQIHCHIFDLESRILVGSLCNREYTVAPDALGTWAVAEAVYNGNHSARVTTQARVRCELSSQHTYGPSEKYTMRRGVFHDTHILAWPTATLMSKINVDRSGTPINLLPTFISNASRVEFNHLDIGQEKAWRIVLQLLEGMRI